MSDYLYADPDGIDKVAVPYSEAASNFQKLSGRLDEMRARYSNAWGNDSTGDQVRPQVEAALKQMQQQVDALGKALGMYHDGLKGTSKAYREADSAAGDAGKQFAGGMDRLAVKMPPASTGGDDTQYKARDWSAATPATPRETVEGEEYQGQDEVPAEPRMRAMKSTHLLARQSDEEPMEAGRLEQGRLLARRSVQDGEPVPDGEPVESERFSALEPAIPSEPAQTRYAAERIPAQPLQPTYSEARIQPALRGIPAQPLQPAYRDVMPTEQAIPAEQGIPAERFEARRLEPMIPAEPAIPAQHEFYRSVDPREPAIPADPPAES